MHCMLRVLIFLCFAGVVAAQTKSYTAAESIKAGDLVLADSSGKIRKADFAGFSTEQTFAPGGADEFYPISSSRVLVRKGETGFLMRIGSDSSLSVLQQFWLGNSLVRLDGTRFVAFLAGQVPTYAYVLTVTDSGVSYGPAVQLASGLNRIVRINSTRFLTFGNGFCQLFNCSEDAITPVGTPVSCPLAFFGTTAPNALPQGYPAGTNRLVLAGGVSGSGNQFLIARINGDSVELSGFLDKSKGLPVGVMAGGKLLFFADQKYYVGQVGDTGITYGAGATPEREIGVPVAGSEPFTDKVLFYLREEPVGGARTWLTWVKASGLTITFGRSQNNRTFDNVWVVDETRVFGLASGKVRVINPSEESYKLTRFLGVAEQSVGKGSSCTITIGGGVTKRFTGLDVGEFYYLTENGPILDATQGYLPIGKALKSDQLMVLYDLASQRIPN